MSKVDGFPDKGMYYKQAESHAKRFAEKGQFQTVNNLIKQVECGEGKAASRELANKMHRDYKHMMKER